MGSTSEVTVTGIDLEDARAIYFSHSNMTASLQTNGPGKFLVTIGTNVPAGTYDARGIGRFGITNPRRFAVGDLDEVIEKQNDSVETAMQVPLGTIVNGHAEANAVDYFKFRATNGSPTPLARVAPLCLPLRPGLARRSRNNDRANLTAPLKGRLRSLSLRLI